MDKTLMPYQSVLKNIPLFSQISHQELDALFICLNARIKHYEKNEPVLPNGTQDIVGIVLDGTVQLCDIDHLGNQILLSLFQPGDLFGAACAFSQTPTLFPLTARQSCTVLLLDGNRMTAPCLKNCASHVRLLQNALRLIAERNVLLSQKIEILSKRLIRDKILTYLHFQSNRLGKSTFEIPFDRQGLADFLCVERSALSATISKLQKEGVLSVYKNQFTLL